MLQPILISPPIIGLLLARGPRCDGPALTSNRGAKTSLSASCFLVQGSHLTLQISNLDTEPSSIRPDAAKFSEVLVLDAGNLVELLEQELATAGGSGIHFNLKG